MIAALCRRGVVLAALALASCGPDQPDHVVVKRVSGALPVNDPNAGAWDSAEEAEVALLPQNVVTPHVSAGGITRVHVRALHDGSRIAFLLRWSDATKDDVSGPSRFSDAAAVQLPSRAGERPSPMMGNPPSGIVRMIYWRAGWQTAHPMERLYPNMPPTYHPHESAQDASVREAMERGALGSTASGNPTVVRTSGGPVMALMASGYGTIQPDDSGIAVSGRGAYARSSWRVVLVRPIGDVSTSPVAPGRSGAVAFAIWNGSHGDAGGRKMRSDWVTLDVEGGS